MKNKLIPIIISGLILRFILMSFFYHPDLKSQAFHAQFLSSRVFNIYSYLDTNNSNLPYKDTFNYPPLTYFTLGGWQSIIKLPLSQPLLNWLNDWGTSAPLHTQIPLFLFWLKLPYLLLDLVFLFLLLKNISNQKKTFATYVWSYNPISLYAIYMIGQFDIIPALLTFTAYLLTLHKKYVLAVLLLSVAVGFKTYPFLLLPFVMMRISKFNQIIKSILVFLGVSSLWIVPFIKSPQFLASVFQSSHGQRLFIAGIDIGFGQILPISLIIYGLLLGYSWLNRTRTDLLPEFLISTSIIIAFAHFHAQWAIWCLPFILLLIIRQRQYLTPSLVIMLLYFLTLLLLPDQYVLVGLFTPQNPQLTTIPPLTDLFTSRASVLSYQSMFHAILTGILILIFYQSLKQHENLS